MKHVSVLCTVLAALAPALAACSSGPGPGVLQLPVAEWIQAGGSEPDVRGRPVVVEFWATWCPPCVESVPHLVDLHERYKSRGLAVLGVHVESGARERDAIEQFLKDRDVPYPIGLDLDGRAGRAFGIRGIPKAFVYDRAGKLVWSGHPAEPGFDPSVAAAVGG